MIINSIFDYRVLLTNVLSAILFVGWFGYWYKNDLLRTERERAYVCALVNSSVTFFSSLPLVYTLLTNGGDIEEILIYRTWTVFVTAFFMTYLVMDLILGVLFYKNKMELLTCWIHHISYLILLTWVIHKTYSAVFIMMCSLELPTFILALGSVRSNLRRDYLFAFSFFITRIMFHLYTIRCAWLLDPFGSVMNALLIFFPVHCFWFYGFIKQQIRLSKQRKENEKVLDKETTVVTTITTKNLVQPNQSVKQTKSKLLSNQRKKPFNNSSTLNYTILHSRSATVSVH